MRSELLADARLYELLQKFDEDIFANARKEACSICRGKLHSATFPRKPRGALRLLPVGYASRFSLCCSNEACRRRMTPASLRFLGRKVYLGVVVTLATALRHGVTAARGEALAKAVGASRQTLARWRSWWREAFCATRFWQEARAMLETPVAEAELPLSLMERFEAPDEASAIALFLDFIKPLTTRAIGNWKCISMGSTPPQTTVVGGPGEVA